MAKKIVVVGGVAGGMSFAARYRRLNEDDEIVVLERGGYISFANCGLPYHLSGVIAKRESLLLKTAKDMKDKLNIDVFIHHEAIKIDKANKTITVNDLENNNIYQINYDKLIIATGSKPFIPPITGIENVQNLLTLRGVEDMDTIKAVMQTLSDANGNQNTKEALVLGGGFIGLEVAENLVKAGFKVNLVEMANQVMTNLDEDMALYIREEMESHGLVLHLGVKVEKFVGNKAILSNGKEINAPMVIASMGVKPDSSLVDNSDTDTDIKLDFNGGIMCDDGFKADTDIYAIGDVITNKHFITGSRGYFPLANPANRQGRLLADILNGSKARYKGILGVAIAKIFDKAVGSVGLNEKTLTQEKIDYLVVSGHLNSHASYYPNSSRIDYKLLFAKNGKILGFQAIGAMGVDKRLDIIATAIKGNLSVYDMIELETAYAPPFGMAKDLVIMACYAASNILDGNAKNLSIANASRLIKSGEFVLDVRETSERDGGNLIEGAYHIPLGDLRKRFTELPKDKTIYVHCLSGIRSYNAMRFLMLKGYDAINLDGGFTSYKIFNKYNYTK